VVKEYYQIRLSDDDGVLQKYKAIIEHEFFPVSDRKDPPARLSVAKKAITDYKKLTDSQVNIADIMVFYVETGVRFTNEYGDINEAFYRCSINRTHPWDAPEQHCVAREPY
jgi:hypothetical protein